MLGIELTHLTKRFGTTVAVDDVTLTIAPGELFFLLGPSGCGKTTLMRMIAGLIDPTEGRIRFGERDVTHLPTTKRNTALVFQGYALWPHMTVAQNVTFGLDVRGVSTAEKKQRVNQVLGTVQLIDLANRKPMQLSGGQQQRVALARALVVNPDVLLLDEPLSNLDAKLRLGMRSEIRRICDVTNVTAVYVTHDQVEALSIADRIAVIREGRVVQVGTPEQVYRRPTNRFVADFLGKANFFPATVTGREGEQLLLDSPLGTLRSTAFADDVPEGGNVTCAVRPEALTLTDAASPMPTGANVVRARHQRTVYLGHIAEHLFVAAGDVALALEELKPIGRDWPDEPLDIHFSADDLVVLAD